MSARTIQTGKLAREATLVVLVAALGVTGCAGKCPFLVKTPPAELPAGGAIPGELSVMLPCDVRPKLEHKGDSPSTEVFIPLLLACFYCSRGNNVSSDGDFGSPYDSSDARDAGYGPGPVVATGVGEGVYRNIQGWKLFERCTRLRPTKTSDAGWPIPAKGPPPPPRLSACKDNVWCLCSDELAAQELRCRAEHAPLPECASDWLLRTRIVHVYSGQHRLNKWGYYVIPLGPVIIFGWSSNKQKQPLVANAVLDCELFRMKPAPELVWRKTIRGVAQGSAASEHVDLVRRAFADAMEDLRRKLQKDAPRIRSLVQGPGESVAVGLEGAAR
jgi:hypothetical protein